MMPFVLLFLVSVLFPATQAKQLTKCEVPHALKDLDGYGGITLLKWACIIFHTSGYDTQTIVKSNGSTEYGLFQISNNFWCRSSQLPQSKNVCEITCDKLVDDDLTDDVKCVQKILDIKGIDYWLAHKALCSEKLDQWRCEKL
ncbi:alpha-lactalbumin [Perognathus longimembris pacificus]|uniref:alpha-lactalbumin n=1 Tax=Perognathus longimembris pacificus TaxID=214514 RepID=UPI0020197E93|nr:alpha-lactalbumin [Perognathus longimembris pacificus]